MVRLWCWCGVARTTPTPLYVWCGCGVVVVLVWCGSHHNHTTLTLNGCGVGVVSVWCGCGMVVVSVWCGYGASWFGWRMSLVGHRIFVINNVPSFTAVMPRATLWLWLGPAYFMYSLASVTYYWDFFSACLSVTCLTCEEVNKRSFAQLTLWVSFEHNFRKYCSILVILSLLQTEIICPQTDDWISTIPIVCCCTTLNNATTYTSSQKLLNKSAMHAVILLLLQSRKFWWYLLLTYSMLLHDVIMTSYCCPVA